MGDTVRTERVRVWELGVDARIVVVKRYCTMLDHAISGLVGGLKKQRLAWGYKCNCQNEGILTIANSLITMQN